MVEGNQEVSQAGGTPWRLERRIPAHFKAGRRIVQQITERLVATGWRASELFGVRLAIEEAVVNAIKHGNQHDPHKRVHVTCTLTAERFWIRIADEGPGFDPEAVPDCTLDENLTKPSGRGVKLMQHYMTRVEYNKAGNCVEMEKLAGRP